ncbi:MAG: 30S ribosomal protein S9 [Rickettsiales bacterium]|nr:MAG: 30S ribosomal protein S9 [Rickettsiales bacterium]
MEIPTLKELQIEVTNNPAADIAQREKFVPCRSRKSTPDGGGYGTGRRKNSIARVWVKPGKGIVTVNKKLCAEYFSRESYVTSIMQPFLDTNTNGQFDVVCTVKGGGSTGQAGAILNGIARALDAISEDYHSVLRKNGFLTRDSRIVERKKYGRRKARKKAQFSKR